MHIACVQPLKCKVEYVPGNKWLMRRGNTVFTSTSECSNIAVLMFPSCLIPTHLLCLDPFTVDKWHLKLCHKVFHLSFQLDLWKCVCVYIYMHIAYSCQLIWIGEFCVCVCVCAVDCPEFYSVLWSVELLCCSKHKRFESILHNQPDDVCFICLLFLMFSASQQTGITGFMHVAL